MFELGLIWGCDCLLIWLFCNDGGCWRLFIWFCCFVLLVIWVVFVLSCSVVTD